MAGLGLDVRLEIGGTAEGSAERLVEDARAVAVAEEVIVLARDDESGALEFGCVSACGAGGEGDRLADSERFFVGLGEDGHGTVVGARFEESLNRGEDVDRGEVAAVKGGEGTGPLQACDPRLELFFFYVTACCVLFLWCLFGSVGDVRGTRYECVRGIRAIGVTDQNEVSRFANRRVCAPAH